ncbi:hypothetical protein IJG78_03965 [Candidatus Saccharibacteria bacterium]|nr:hypothetical protein [Candidatus Saccharibacteria bacterium]
MDVVSNGTKRVLISFRLIFIAAIILVFAVATSIKKPSRGRLSTPGLGTIAYLADFVPTPEEDKASKNSVASDHSDDPDVPITSSPETPKEDNKDGNETSESPATSPSTKEDSNTANNTTRSGTHKNTSQSDISTAKNASKNAISNSSSSYSNEIYVDDRGENIDNPVVFPIPYQESDPVTDDNASEEVTDDTGETIITPLPNVPSSSQTE